MSDYPKVIDLGSGCTITYYSEREEEMGDGTFYAPVETVKEWVDAAMRCYDEHGDAMPLWVSVAADTDGADDDRDRNPFSKPFPSIVF